MCVALRLRIGLNNRLRLIGGSPSWIRAQGKSGYERNGSGNEQNGGKSEFTICHTVLSGCWEQKFWVDKPSRDEASFARENAVTCIERHLFWGDLSFRETKGRTG